MPSEAALESGNAAGAPARRSTRRAITGTGRLRQGRCARCCQRLRIQFRKRIAAEDARKHGDAGEVRYSLRKRSSSRPRVPIKTSCASATCHHLQVPDTAATSRCFIAMPITTHSEEADRYGGDAQHWKHVMESLFVPAITAAGYEPVVPAAKGAYLIHASIIKHLSESDLVLCDLSSHNPNVFFELGVRTSINLPVALVKDEHTSIPFDTSGINTFQYKSALNGWDMETEIRTLAQHIRDSADSCNGQNPLWSQFGLSITAQEPSSSQSPLEAKVDVMMDEFSRVVDVQRNLLQELSDARNAAVRQRTPSRSAARESNHVLVGRADSLMDGVLDLFVEHDLPGPPDFQFTSEDRVSLKPVQPITDKKILRLISQVGNLHGFEVKITPV